MGSEPGSPATEVSGRRRDLHVRERTASPGFVQEHLFKVAQTLPPVAPNGLRLPPLGNSPAIRKLVQTIFRVAPTEATILLGGETGVGKGFMAGLIHHCSPRSRKPLIELVCGALPQNLIESELFGHEQGSFTGALSSRAGRFELAADGTIFLDEIGDLPLDMQVKLLRVLQDRKFERVGGTSTLTASARVIVATNRDLRRLVWQGRFREDLYYRLNVVRVEVPPLRERRDDIPDLIQAFLEEFGVRHRGLAPALTSEALELLTAYAWPGNVRDLRNCIESLVVLDDKGEIGVNDLPPEVRQPSIATGIPIKGSDLKGERERLLFALAQSRGNKTEASRIFGKSRRQFYRLLQKHHIL